MSPFLRACLPCYTLLVDAYLSGPSRVGLTNRAEKRLNLPLPEMTFGNNSLLLTYQGGDEETTFRFNGLEALAEVGVGEGWEERVGGGVLVSMAETWGKNR